MYYNNKSSSKSIYITDSNSNCIINTTRMLDNNFSLTSLPDISKKNIEDKKKEELIKNYSKLFDLLDSEFNKD